jgi:Pentapeptide repeats (8 copies)
MSPQANLDFNEDEHPDSIPDMLEELERSDFKNRGSGELAKLQKNSFADNIKKLDWKIIAGVVATTVTGVFGLITHSELDFRTVLSQINESEIGKRNDGIISIKKTFEDCKPFTINGFFSNPVNSIISVFVNQNEKQWKITKVLDNSISTYYHAPSPLNMDEKIIKKKYSVGKDLQNALDILAKDKLVSTSKPPETIVLKESNLYNAQLINAKLADTDFNRSYLYLANLKNADLNNAHFNGAYLRSTTLTGADLTGADLTNADLHSAVMRGATFSNEQIIKSCHWSKAIYDEERLNSLPPKDSDKSTKKSECNNGIISKKQNPRKYSSKNSRVNKKSAMGILSSHKIKQQHNFASNDRTNKKSSPSQASSGKSKHSHDFAKNDKTNKKSTPNKLHSSKLKRHHSSVKNDRKKTK